MVARILDYLRGPDDAAARIITAENRHDHPVIGADILEPAEDAGRDIDHIALFQHHLAVIAPGAPEKTPAARQHEEHLGRAMRMERVPTLRRLAGSADVETRRVGDVDMLVRGFRDTPANNGEVLFQVASRRVRINKGGAARHQVAIADNTFIQVNGTHLSHPVCMTICFQIAVSSNNTNSRRRPRGPNSAWLMPMT